MQKVKNVISIDFLRSNEIIVISFVNTKNQILKEIVKIAKKIIPAYRIRFCTKGNKGCGY